MAQSRLLSERSRGTLLLTLNRPESMNAIDRDLAVELRRGFDEAARQDEIRCIVLTGAGRAFSSGGDVREMHARLKSQPGDFDLGDELRHVYGPLARSIRDCPKPVIAAINGTAAGAGLSLALACDLRLAAAGAQLILAFVRIGLVPDAGSLFFLSRIVGIGRALEMALTGDPVSAEQAERIGLVGGVVPPDELLPKALERADQMSALPAEALRMIKSGMERGLSLDLDQALELEAMLQSRAGRTADHHEALSAFIEKRRPAFGATDGAESRESAGPARSGTP
jgi:2-(1,2-epoxy-1,2-dihydrophenyl)acetyl-CoA isomerase